jgi:hypothetical protein
MILKGGKRKELVPEITFILKKEKKLSLRSKSYNFETWAATFPLVSTINGLHGRV